jgi:hypothetical protein
MGAWVLNGAQGAPAAVSDLQLNSCVICGKGRTIFYTWSKIDEDELDSITVELCGDATCLYNTRKWIMSDRTPQEILGQRLDSESSPRSSVSWWEFGKRRALTH